MSNPGIFQSSFPAERMRGAKLVEDFRDALTVARNGWTVAGAPTFAGGGTFDGVDDAITQGDVVLGVNGVSFWVTLGSVSEEIITLSATHSVSVSAGVVTATGWTAPTIFVNGVATTAIGLGRSFVTIVTSTSFTADTIIVGKIGVDFGAFKIERLAIWATPSVLTLSEHTAYYDGSMFNWRNRATVDLQMRMQDYDPTNVRTLDSSGHANHFTLGNGSTPTTYPTQGNGRMTFDGGDYLNGGDKTAFEFGDGVGNDRPFTLCLTAALDLTNRCTFAKGHGATVGEYGLFTIGTNAFLRCFSSVGNYIGRVATGSLVSGAIQTIVATYDGTKVEGGMRIYVNGVRADTGSASGGVYTWMSATAGTLGIGGPDKSFYPLGSIYHAGLFDFALNNVQAADYHLQMMRTLGTEV